MHVLVYLPLCLYRYLPASFQNDLTRTTCVQLLVLSHGRGAA
jgi:hypothetical protein